MPKRVVIDIDAGTDDAFALILLLSAEEQNNIEIVAITCVNGNTSVNNVFNNVKRLLKICNREDVPVYIGASEPLLACEIDEKNYFHGKDGFGDLEYEEDGITVKNIKSNSYCCKTNNSNIEYCSNSNAIVMLNKLAMENPGELTLIALGPLTNIGLAMKVYAQFALNIKEIFIMGGNYKGVGNVTSAAEFNFHVDPEAAYIVLHFAKCPITILPWEPCMDSTITFEWRYNVLGKSNHPTISLLNAAEKNIYPTTEPIWMPCDALLVAAFLYPEIVRQSNECHASVELQGAKTRAQVVINHRKDTKPNTSIITELNYDLFKIMLLRAFNK